MAASRGELLMQAMLAALNAPAGKLATTFRNRQDAYSAAEFPARVLYAGKETVTASSAKARLRKRMVRVEHMIQADAPADLQLDPLLVEVAQILTADPSFGGLAKGLYESMTEWETVSSYKDLCLAVTEFELHYTTAEDPSVAGAQ